MKKIMIQAGLLLIMSQSNLFCAETMQEESDDFVHIEPKDVVSLKAGAAIKTKPSFMQSLQEKANELKQNVSDLYPAVLETIHKKVDAFTKSVNENWKAAGLSTSSMPSEEKITVDYSDLGDDSNPLINAIRNKDIATVKQLVENDFNMQVKDTQLGVTALHNAARAGSEEIIKYLIDQGARLSSDVIHNDSAIEKKVSLQIIQKQHMLEIQELKNQCANEVQQKVAQALQTATKKQPATTSQEETSDTSLSPDAVIPKAPPLPDALNYTQEQSTEKQVETKKPEQPKQQVKQKPSVAPKPQKRKMPEIPLTKESKPQVAVTKTEEKVIPQVQAQPQEKEGSSRSALLDQIREREGKTLKKVSQEKPQVEKSKFTSNDPLEKALRKRMEQMQKGLNPENEDDEKSKEEDWE